MDLKTMRSELQRLSELVAGWDAPRDISPLERDLALEKLRRLYEALRFGADVPEAEDAAPVTVPLSIELDDVFLSVSVPEEETMHVTGAGPERETAPVAEAAPEEVCEPLPPLPEPDSGSEPVSDPMSEPEDGPEVFEELTVETAPAREATTAPESPEPEAAPESPEPAPQPVAPTLFELEDETVRHRRKQRVIMSLYDTEPAASVPESGSAADPKSAAATTHAPVSGPHPTPASVGTPPPAEPESRRSAEALEDDTVFAAGEPAPQPADSTVVDAVAAAPESETESRPAPHNSDSAESAAGTVLGEVINHDVKTLSDTIAPPRDVASALRRSEPVTDLRRAVGINDKFLLIRDLFGGDGAAYEITIRRLNEFDNFDDCMIYIAENFAWNPNSDGAKLLMELLERKFS